MTGSRASRVLSDARWWFLDYVYAVHWQVRAAFSGANSRQYLSGSGRAVLVIPGIFETWQFLRPTIEALHAAGHPVHVVTLLQNNRVPLVAAAHLVADYLDQHDLDDVVIVSHSKGGLVGKYVMLQPGSGARVSQMVAVAAPFGGSRYARYLPLRSLRAFSASDPGLSALNVDVSVNARITSVFGVFDPHIPEGSALIGAENVQLDTGGHFRVLADPVTVSTVLARAAA
ncbi:esterase/lipase family protein [Subtercola boreus]|uniref:Alpha/beta hydrolase n=1 Tax=Subtercola boreus TaxID=120213 RepID=A0A3E0W7G7_9MICO|nr:alpha/beta hydrolase [Subtercola boreus]RFA19035.1 alpha/beta hydrolase [Subtercola boreus]RFA19173.1 alpha/beta hydrolase [Subtercola boreus]RFA25635.1 alpha/beta hydrolase [Subtercola boreus]